MEKRNINAIVDYLRLLNELKDAGKSLMDTNEALTLLASDKISGIENTDEIVVTPFGTGDMVAVIVPSNLPNQFEGLTIDADFSVTILTVAHFNFLFAFKGEKKVVVFVRS